MLRFIEYKSLNCRFISIRKVAELIGLDTSKVKSGSDRDRLAQYLERLPSIRKLVRKKYVKLGNSIKRYYFYDYRHIINFLNNHISRKDAIEYIGVSIATFDIYKENYNIITYKIGNRNEYKFYPRKGIEQIYNDFNYDSSKYHSIYKFAEEQFGNTSPSFIWRLKKHIEDLPPGIITPIKLAKFFHDNEEKRYINVIYSKEEFRLFREKYISKSEAFAFLTQLVDKTTVYKHYNVLNIYELSLGNQTNTIFISKHDYLRVQDSINKTLKIRANREEGILIIGEKKYYTRQKTIALLCTGPRTIDKIEQEYLKAEGQYKNSNYYSKKEVDMLIEKQKEMLELYRKDYYSFGQIQSKYNDNYARQITKLGNIEYVVRRESIPPLIKNFFHHNIMTVFSKEDIDGYWDIYNLNLKLSHNYFDNRYEDFIYKVETIMKISFSENQTYTKMLWYEYVRKQLTNTNRIHEKDYINIFVGTTNIIQGVFADEIYLYTSREINKRFLNCNNDIPRNYQRQFYNFLKKIESLFNEQNKSIQYNTRDLNNPMKYERMSEEDTSIYTIEQYHNLYNYVSQVDFHKSRAISDVKGFIESNNRSKYKKYDSCWLYVLVLLVNNWRHSTVFLQIPRIDLQDTNIESLDWLLDNEPTLDDANNIIFQIGRYVTKINKTEVSAEGIFQMGEPLKTAFATAISICEFRTRAMFPEDSFLLMFAVGEKTVDNSLVKTKNPHKYFFEAFDKDFYFENRKMNRTLSTLIYSVLHHFDDGLKAAQVSRSHTDEQTTIDHYIKLSDLQISNLVEELFARDNFGFVVQLMSNIIFGKSVDRRIELARLKAIKESFGDQIKIEATAGLLNRLSSQKIEAESYIRSLSINNLKKLYQNMVIGNLPSKQKYYQCIYTECKYEVNNDSEQSCEGCPASIINVYALSQLMDNYMNSLVTIVENFDTSPFGEKRKIANHFHMLNEIVLEARKKFGIEVVNGFVSGGTEHIKLLGSIISRKEIKKYVSLNIKGE